MVNTIFGSRVETRTEGPDVDVFIIIQIVQDTVIHLEVDEEQWEDHARMSEASEVGMVPTYDVRSTASRYSSCSTSNTTIHAFRPENNVGVSSQTMNDTRRVLLLLCFLHINRSGLNRTQ